MAEPNRMDEWTAAMAATDPFVAFSAMKSLQKHIFFNNGSVCQVWIQYVGENRSPALTSPDTLELGRFSNNRSHGGPWAMVFSYSVYFL
jgi:hypothetical protein